LSGFLLDTNVISELRKPRPNQSVVRFVRAQSETDLFLSDISFAEIRFGIQRLEDPDRRASIEIWLDNNLRPLFAGRTLAITEETLLRWRLKIEAGRKRGHTFGQPDLFIAVQAEENGLIAVTRDVSHFVEAAVAVLDPWTSRFIDPTGAERKIADLGSPLLLK
jgi:predicted nucleic acid-binding protein